MTITQTVEIPDNRWLSLQVPCEIPTKSVIVTFSPSISTLETSLQNTTQNKNPISRYFGILSPNTYGDGLAFQRELRDEWDD